MIDNRNRAFHYAVLASLALHALLLFAFPEIIDTARRAVSIPPQIIARLMEPEPAPAPAPAPPAQPVPQATPPAKKVPQLTKPAPVSPTPPAPEVTADKPAQPQAETPAPPAPVAPPPVAAVEPQPPPPASPPVVQAPESLSRDQYRLQLIDAARRIKKEMRYPTLARENNWKGEVPLSVQVAANGRASVTLRGSSGYEVLDRHGLQLFRQAAREVPVPQALRGREFALEVRAIYDLED